MSDCNVPVCSSQVEALERMRALTQGSSTQGPSGKGSSKTSRNASTNAASTNAASPPPPPNTSTPECPLGREVLGLFTWSFLHTMAAHYPPSPSSSDRTSMSSLIHSISNLYPCTDCRTDFKESVKRSPPEPHTSNKQTLQVYLCERHNEVNRKLNKEQFECDPKLLDERWRTGVKGCDGGGLHPE